MNLLGVDVSGLDLAQWVRGAQLLYVAAALGWLALALRRRSPRLLLLGVLLANAWVFVVTCWPLQRLYALGPSRDRVNNLGLCQVVAAGNAPWETAQPGQLHFEPFWGLLMALLSGFDPARLIEVYAFMPLVTVLLFALALEWGLRPTRAEPAADDAWERALVVGFATLLCAGPLDYLSGYRVSWAMTFLLKPNHALGLVMLPLVLRALAGARSWRALVVAGFLLNMMGWAFVIHMGFAAAGLLVYVLLSFVARRADRRRDLRHVLLVLGFNLLAVSPYLYLLLSAYPFLVPRHQAVVPDWSPHLLEVTFRAGWLFPVGAWGALVLWRRGDRLSRLWASQALAAPMLWAGAMVLSQARLARELDEFYFWCRFMLAVAGGVGAWDLARRAWDAWGARQATLLRLAARFSPGPARAHSAPLLAVSLSAALLPASLPYWWDPARMDPLFPGSVEPLPQLVAAPTAWLRAHSRPGDVVAGDREYAPWVTALGARRVLLSSRLNMPRDWLARAGIEAALLRGDERDAASRARERFGVRFLVVTPALLRSYGRALEDLQRRQDLALVHLTREAPQRFVAVFEVAPRPPQVPARGPRP